MSETLNQRNHNLQALLKRNVFPCVGNYRFDFNGKEKDNEVKGDGNSLDFGGRIYDSRLGRWLSLDALMAKFPYISPYNYSLNCQITFAYRTSKENKYGTINMDEVVKCLNDGEAYMNGTVVHVEINTVIKFAKNKRETKKGIDANEAFGVNLEIGGKKSGYHASKGKCDFIHLGDKNNDAQLAHELGLDIEFGNHYAIGESKKNHYPVVSRADSLMTGNNPINQTEYNIIARDVLEKCSLDRKQESNGNNVVRPLI